MYLCFYLSTSTRVQVRAATSPSWVWANKSSPTNLVPSRYLSMFYSLSLHTSVYLSITFDVIDVMIDWSSIIDAILTIILLICIYTSITADVYLCIHHYWYVSMHPSLLIYIYASITAPVGAVQLVFPKADRGSLVPEGTSDIGPGTCLCPSLD